MPAAGIRRVKKSDLANDGTRGSLPFLVCDGRWHSETDRPLQPASISIAFR
jgi:hypothetical protein